MSPQSTRIPTQLLAIAAQPAATPVTQYVPEMMMVLGVLLIGFLLIISIRGKIARRNAAITTPREHIEGLKSAAAARQDAEIVKAELHETARELAARMTNRAQVLEQLIADADQRIAQLEQMQTTSPQQPRTHDSRIAASARAASSKRPSRPAPHIEPLGDAPVRATPPSAARESIDPLTRSIYDLADRGATSVEIARELNEQTGKVELILALRKSA